MQSRARKVLGVLCLYLAATFLLGATAPVIPATGVTSGAQAAAAQTADKKVATQAQRSASTGKTTLPARTGTAASTGPQNAVRAVSANDCASACEGLRGETRLAVLQAQNTLIKDYQDDLLSTVYWALAGLTTLLILFAGYNWFAAFRLQKEEKEELKRWVSDAIISAAKEQKSSLEIVRGELMTLLSERSAVVADDVRQAIDLFRQEISTQMASEHDGIEDLKKVTARNARDILFVESKMRQVEIHMWDMQGHTNNVLITYAQAVRAARRSGKKAFLSGLLDRLEDFVDEHIKIKNEHLDNYSVTTLQKELDELSVDSALKVRKIKKILSEAKIDGDFDPDSA